jgi:16S rRNA U516 pseudouridylate synthase RsuA-like enzyme
MKLSAAKIAKRENADLAALDNFETIYKTQQQSISRRLLGSAEPANNRAVTYLTQAENEAVKSLAAAIGINVSTLIRLTLVTLAAAGLPAEYDPRLD